MRCGGAGRAGMLTCPRSRLRCSDAGPVALAPAVRAWARRRPVRPRRRRLLRVPFSGGPLLRRRPTLLRSRRLPSLRSRLRCSGLVLALGVRRRLVCLRRGRLLRLPCSGGLLARRRPTPLRPRRPPSFRSRLRCSGASPVALALGVRQRPARPRRHRPLRVPFSGGPLLRRRPTLLPPRCLLRLRRHPQRSGLAPGARRPRARPRRRRPPCVPFSGAPFLRRRPTPFRPRRLPRPQPPSFRSRLRCSGRFPAALAPGASRRPVRPRRRRPLRVPFSGRPLVRRPTLLRPRSLPRLRPPSPRSRPRCSGVCPAALAPGVRVWARRRLACPLRVRSSGGPLLLRPRPRLRGRLPCPRPSSLVSAAPALGIRRRLARLRRRRPPRVPFSGGPLLRRRPTPLRPRSLSSPRSRLRYSGRFPAALAPGVRRCPVRPRRHLPCPRPPSLRSRPRCNGAGPVPGARVWARRRPVRPPCLRSSGVCPAGPALGVRVWVRRRLACPPRVPFSGVPLPRRLRARPPSLRSRARSSGAGPAPGVRAWAHRPRACRSGPGNRRVPLRPLGVRAWARPCPRPPPRRHSRSSMRAAGQRHRRRPYSARSRLPARPCRSYGPRKRRFRHPYPWRPHRRPCTGRKLNAIPPPPRFPWHRRGR